MSHKELFDRMWSTKSYRTACVLFLALGLCTLWVYGRILAVMVGEWIATPEYSHGFLVPLFSLALLYRNRSAAADLKLGYHWSALPFFLFGAITFFAGELFYFDWLIRFSLIPYLTGMVVLFGGMKALKWAWPSLCFLVFAIPLPFRLHEAMASPLQTLATIMSTYILQTIGLPAISEGHLIFLNEHTLEVERACSGLSMLFSFVAISFAVAFWVRRDWWEKGIILVSSIPIAVACNVLRIVVTGILHQITSHELANIFFHDVAGLLMMPLGLGFLWVEMAAMRMSVIEVEKAPPKPIALGKLSTAPSPAPESRGPAKKKKGDIPLPARK